MRNVQAVLAIVLGLFLVAVAVVVIRDGSEVVAGLGEHIMGLFRRATLNPGRRGFSSFVQLVIIAVFVGWAISRFKNMRRK
jgi:hypothetical protein